MDEAMDEDEWVPTAEDTVILIRLMLEGVIDAEQD